MFNPGAVPLIPYSLGAHGIPIKISDGNSSEMSWEICHFNESLLIGIHRY